MNNNKNINLLFKFVYDIILKMYIMVKKELLYKDYNKNMRLENNIEKTYDKKINFFISKIQHENLILNNISYDINSTCNSTSTLFTLNKNNYNNLKLDLKLKLEDNMYIEIPKNKEEKNLDFGILYDKNNCSIGILYVDTEFNFNIETYNNNVILLLNNINIYEDNDRKIEIKLILTNYLDYFIYTKWIERKDMISLSLKYTQNLITSKCSSEKHAKILDSWLKVCNMHSKDKYWQNRNYLC